MPNNIDNSQKPLFLTSPPGSNEAVDIGYINIPKIVKEPPPELGEVQEFTDNTGCLYSAQESNFWVYRPFIENKKVSHDFIIPLFPSFLKYAVPWIVCEYALYCVEEDDLLGLRGFVENTIKKRISDYDISTILYKKAWREKEKPINWIKIYAKCKKRKKLDNLGLYHKKDRRTGQYIYLKADKPIVTGDSFDEEKSLTVLESLYKKRGRQKYKPDPRSDIFDSLWETTEDKLFNPMFEDEFWNAVDEGCKNVGLSETATNLLITYLESTTSVRSASMELNLSEKTYEAARKELQRKKSTLKNYINNIEKLKNYLP